MKKGNIIAIMDFDDTLYNTPLPTEENRELLREKKNYMKSGWWGRKESLDLDVFDILINPFTKERYDFHNEEDHYKILMTGRIIPLRHQVRKIFKKDDLSFDEEHYADGRKTFDFKSEMILDIVKRKTPTEIFFYDDRTHHIQGFRRLGDKIEDEYRIKFRLFHVVNPYEAYELKYGKKMR